MTADTRPSFISEQVRQGRYFFLDLAPPRQAPLAVVCGGREVCAEGYDVDRPGFRYFAIEYVIEGEGRLRLGDQAFTIQPGSVFAYGPDVPHRIRAVGRRRLVKYFVDFTGDEAASLLGPDAAIAGRPRQLVRSRWVHDIFDQMIDAGSLPKASARPQCELLLRLLSKRLEVDAQPIGEAASAAFETYCRCRRYIEDHYRATSSVAEVAAACDVAPAYLSRLFRRFAQEGPLQFLTRIKMDKAADLLAWSNESVAGVAAAVGFEDPYHFSRVFKRVHGLAPRDFARTVARRGGTSSDAE